MKLPLYFFIALILLNVFNSCAPENKKPAEEAAVTDTTPVNALAEFKFTYTVANLPPPMKVLDEFSRSDLPADVSLLNPVAKATTYKTSMQHAFNYGIYGVDLAYAVFNERMSEVRSYYPVVKRLAEELNMSETFNEFMHRFESNTENRDSLTRITDELYSATDSYLRSNERLAAASQILAGSWVECQYIVVHLLLNNDRTDQNENLYNRVWEQRLYLDNISGLLDQFDGNTELENIKAGFRNLLSIYKKLPDAKDITPDHLRKLSQGLSAVRTRITG